LTGRTYVKRNARNIPGINWVNSKLGKTIGRKEEIKNKPVKRSFNKLDPERLKMYIENLSDAYLKEIAQGFGCSAPAVLKALRRLDYTRKKRRNITKNKT